MKHDEVEYFFSQYALTKKSFQEKNEYRPGTKIFLTKLHRLPHLGRQRKI